MCLHADAIHTVQVAEAAVIAVPHPKWDERPLLIVVPVEGAQLVAADMLSFLKVSAMVYCITFFFFQGKHVKCSEHIQYLLTYTVPNCITAV